MSIKRNSSKFWCLWGPVNALSVTGQVTDECKIPEAPNRQIKAVQLNLRSSSCGTSLAIQGFRLRLPMQGVQVWSLLRELRSHMPGFPGGAVVENLPANAGDTGSNPGLGRSHMPRSNWAREPQLLSLCSTIREAAIVRGPCTTMKSGSHLPQLEKALA